MKPQNQAIEQHSKEQGHKGSYGSSPSGAASIITETISAFDSANVVANSSVDTTVAVPGATVGDAVMVTPLAALETGLVVLAMGLHTPNMINTKLIRSMT